MSKTYQNISKSDRGCYDLWGRRGSSWFSRNSWSKKMCRRLERREKYKLILKELIEHEI